MRGRDWLEWNVMNRTRFDAHFIERPEESLPNSPIVPNATEGDRGHGRRYRLLEYRFARKLAIQIKRRFCRFVHQSREMPRTGPQWLRARNRAPATLLQISLQMPVRLDGDAPLPFNERVAILADQHLLLTFESLQIEPKRDGK